jgi:hypothetical protein
MTPFNLDKYNDQAVCTKTEMDVEIVRTDIKSTYCIIGIIQCPDGTQIVDCFDKFGISASLFDNNLYFKPKVYKGTLKVYLNNGILNYNLIIDGVKNDEVLIVGDPIEEFQIVFESASEIEAVRSMLMMKDIDLESEHEIEPITEEVPASESKAKYPPIELKVDTSGSTKAVKVNRVDERGHIEMIFESLSKAAKFVEMNQVTFKKKVMKHEKFSDGFYYIMEPDMEDFLLDLAEKTNGKESK